MRLGIIARMDDTGLGNQTRNLTYMLKPERIMIIDSTPFKTGVQQHPEWYASFTNKIIVRGFPTMQQIQSFLYNIDCLLTCEIPYGYEVFQIAKKRSIKTFLQYNFEFFDYFIHPNLPLPTQLIAPSSWRITDIQSKTMTKPVLLPPPIFITDYAHVRHINMTRHENIKTFIHVVGNKAIHDRNGTKDVIAAVQKSKQMYKLIIKSQYPIDDIDIINDKRIEYNFFNEKDSASLYKDCDALILPRRYGGLSLPMNEGLASGLPVIMTDIEPNDNILPKNWLVKSYKLNDFMARTTIDVYGVDIQGLADKLDEFALMDINELKYQKLDAFDRAITNFSADTLFPRYVAVLNGEHGE